MFVILPPDFMEALGTVDAPEIDMAEVYRIYGPDAIVAETLNFGEEALLHPIPPELDRAIDAWNAMVPRLKFHIETVAKRERFVAPYRAWKKKLGKRAYLLEQLIADVEATEFCHSWFRFSLLFRVKDGAFYSDLLHSGQWKNGNGKGEVTEKDFIGLARTAAIWEREHDGFYVGDGSSHAKAFERAIGVSVQRFEELRKRFNGTDGGPNV